MGPSKRIDGGGGGGNDDDDDDDEITGLVTKGGEEEETFCVCYERFLPSYLSLLFVRVVLE